MTGRLDGRIAMITGGAGGIGSDTASLFCAEGARVAIVDLADDTLAAARDQVRDAVPDADVITIACDITQEAQAYNAVARVEDAFGGLSVLVNNAGVREFGPLAERPAESWNRIIDVNIRGTVNCTKAALPALRRAEDGNIVNVASVFAVIARKGMGQYDATKAAIVSMTKTIATEEIEHGVRANVVCPGGVLTPYHLARYAEQGITREMLEEDAKAVPLMGRWAEPREIAFPILWLASKEASFITATTLLVDGGKAAL